MAKPKPQKLTETQEVLLRGIHAAIEILFKRRICEIESQLNKAREVMEIEKLKIAFPVLIDYSEDIPTIKIGLTWSQTVRDDIISSMPDANQGQFDFITVAEAKAASAQTQEEEE